MYWAAEKCPFKTMALRYREMQLCSHMSLHPHSGVCYGVKQWGLSQCTTVSVVSHTSVHDTPGVCYSCVSHLSVSISFPSFLLLPFPHPLCVSAKSSNGCWHILEPCCPTHSLSCAGQVLGSGQDKRTKAISPATNNCFQNRTFVPFTSQIGGYLYPEGKTHPIRGVSIR